MTIKKFAAIFLFIFCLVPESHAATNNLQDLFWQHSWQEMESAFQALPQKTPRDYSLMANAYRFQSKWRECAAILESQSGKFPASIKPYADMTLILCYENSGQNDKAIKLAENLYKSAPNDLKYYVALSQYRIYSARNDSRNTLNALNKMLASAGDDDQKIYTLTRLISQSNNKHFRDHALKLLELQPANKKAAEILINSGRSDNNTKIALGVYYHSIGNNKAALIRLNTATGRKAIYYRAWANSRLKQNNNALTLWGNLAISGNSYAASSVTRIANLAKDKGMMDSCLNVLERIAKERRGETQARALQAIINLTGKNNPQKKASYESKILRSFPGTNYAFKVLWARAWDCLETGRYVEAVKLFRQADAPGVGFYKRARILYWLGHSQALAGQKKESEKTFSLIKRKYPLTIYGLMLKAPINIINGINPNLSIQPSELENWGYIYNAYLRLSRPKASTRELYRALILSRWLGLDESYSSARRLETLLTANTNLYRADLEALYPRPFKNLVDSASKQYGVENNFIWAIMRQESAFKPDARSWVGAAGLMQLMPATAKGEAKRAGLANYDLNNPGDNIKLGTSHLGWLGQSFSRKEWVMAAYNAGSGNARKWMKNGGDKLDLLNWIEAVKFDETCGYVQRVSANLEIYRMLYNAR
ncbi:MAG: transglycosylase SLT domain-containing protein [Synergistaceae bacterium]|nr:transglycosylase SLT domain-containing protein [Synergistaceae bacterium]